MKDVVDHGNEVRSQGLRQPPGPGVQQQVLQVPHSKSTCGLIPSHSTPLVSSKLTTQPTTSFVPRFLSRWTKALGARSGTCQRTGERQRIVRSRAAEADTEVATPIEKCKCPPPPPRPALCARAPCAVAMPCVLTHCFLVPSFDRLRAGDGHRRGDEDSAPQVRRSQWTRTAGLQSAPALTPRIFRTGTPSSWWTGSWSTSRESKLVSAESCTLPHALSFKSPFPSHNRSARIAAV